MNSDIKVTNLEYYKVGTGDCEIYLGTTKLYPLTPPIPPSYDTQYLTFRVLSGGTLGWSGSTTANTLSYSLDSGSTWSTPSTSITINVNSGDTVMWKGECTPVSSNGIGWLYSVWSGAAKYDAEGNIMSLLYGDNFSGQTSLSGMDYVFHALFYYTRICSAEHLVLPATTLSEACYNYMFQICDFLTTPPSVLPATTLAVNCYAGMFEGCTSLTTAPALPATTLAYQCYYRMFLNCTSLVTAPELPATSFSGHNEQFCYAHMFGNCTSLTTAPLLAAPILSGACYEYMFSGCRSLSSITCLATDIYVHGIYDRICTSNWVKDVAPSGVFTKADTMNDWIIDSDDGIPIGWTVRDYNSTQYLTLEAVEDETFKFSGNAVSYSLDNGVTWETLASNTNSPIVSAGNKIMFKGTLTPQAYNGVGSFSSSGRFNAMGNPMSLLYGDNFIGQTSLSGKNYVFANLFSYSTIVSASNLSLPATTLTQYCYRQMFDGCTSLVTPPPILPATTLTDWCYQNMFHRCTSLTTAPTLPATTLAYRCYISMFEDCSGLTVAPELPAATLAEGCYEDMFNHCTSLNSITCLATDISAPHCTQSWLLGVASSGTFIKDPNMTSWGSGASGIPNNWTVQDYNP